MRKKDVPGAVRTLLNSMGKPYHVNKDINVRTATGHLFGSQNMLVLHVSGVGSNSGLPRVIPSDD